MMGNLIADACAGAKPAMGSRDSLSKYVLSNRRFRCHHNIDHCLKGRSVGEVKNAIRIGFDG
jgi:hypothetical protein